MELEYKFLSLGSDGLRQALACARDLGWTVDDRGAVEITDTYYDTPEYDLKANGQSLRCRCANGCWTTAFKAGGTPTDGLFTRQEQEEAVGEDRGPAFMANGMRPTLTLCNTRHLLVLTLSDAQAELSLDRVVYGIQTTETVTYDWQVELELKSEAGREAFEALGQALLRQEGLCAMTQSKYQRGLERCV